MELCKCSLTAGTFLLVQCTPEIRKETDGVFTMSHMINKIIFNYLQVSKDVTLERNVLQALSELLTIKPQYDWSSVQLHESKTLLKNVINKKPVGVQAEFEAVLDYIVRNIETNAFQDENEFLKAQNEFLKFLKYAETWRVFEFISSILGLIAMVAIILICIFRMKILERIILSSAVMEECYVVECMSTWTGKICTAEMFYL